MTDNEPISRYNAPGAGKPADGKTDGRDGERAVTADELMFFDRLPRFLPVYETLKEALAARYPEMTVRVAKTQISFRSRYEFAMVSLPCRRKKEWPREYLMVSFGLPARKISPRIAAWTEAYPGRFTHHVLAERPGDLDAELLGWIDEAYRFSMVK